MQVNVAGFRRNIKNLAHNYSDAQIKVREATSNDPWGPSATIMAEVADLTYNVVAFSEIMQMIWKRLNDHGKNWRHVYKALILLEYLIKTGTEKVAQQCKENIFAIQTLKEFQYQEECNDQGIRVREKAKQLVSLLKDDERLKNERTKALKAKERFAQNASGFGSDGSIDGPTHHRDSPSAWRSQESADGGLRTGGSGGSGGGGAGAAPLEIEYVRPQTVGEEELQLQLAMAMSREEAEQEEAKRRSDDVRLQLALSQSENDFKQETAPPKQESHLLDLLDISLGATSLSSPADAWGMSKPQPSAAHAADPWASNNGAGAAALDPWQSGAMAAGPSGARPMAAIGGGAGAASVESWLSRTQSPSSGSSAESTWLQNGGGGAVGGLSASNGYGQTLGNGATNSSSSNGAAGGGASGLGDPWLSGGAMPKQPAAADPWLNKSAHASAPVAADPWQSPPLSATNGHGGGAAAAAAAAAAAGQQQQQIIDPWAGPSPTIGARPSPIGAQMSPNSDLDDFDVITNRTKSAAANNNNSSFLDDLDPLSTKKSNNSSPAPNAALAASNSTTSAAAVAKSRTPQSFLGENSALVNLDNLIKPAIPSGGAQSAFGAGGLGAAYSNPFGETGTQPKTNLFQQQTQPMPSINQLKQQQPFPVTLNQDPWAPVTSNQAASTNQSSTGNLNFTNNLTQPQAINPMMGINNSNNINNNNNPAPWLRPEAAASNPFLS